MTGDPNNTSQYEEGYANENAVKKVRFYFFDAEGKAAAVKANGDSFYDWDNPSGSDQDMPNVERMLNAVIIISSPNDELPTQVVAVLNPAEEGLTATGNAGNLDLDALRSRVKDYVATATGTDGAFVMINSVYANANRTAEIIATPVTTANYASTTDAALANPVNIYVERNVAKVRVSLATNLVDNNNMIALKDKDGNPIKDADDNQIYLKVGNWSLTAETNEGYLSKRISTSWAADLFGNTEPWNYAPYFRSFWAQNTATAKQTWYNYNDITNADSQNPGRGKGYTHENNANILYTNENAPQTADMTDDDKEGAKVEPFTKVMLAGTLVKADGTPIELVKYAGLTYAGEENIKTILLNILKNNGLIYSKTGTGDATVYSDITADDVEFKTALESNLAKEGEDESGRYKVYLQLSKTGAAKTWTKSNKKDQPADATFANATAANAYLAKSTGEVQIWKSGMTYYYFPIHHLGASGNVGFLGVVRNHIYDCTINSIVGLGTPVYNPGEVIYPEIPDPEYTHIAARIKILSWRVVPNNVDLKW